MVYCRKATFFNEKFFDIGMKIALLLKFKDEDVEMLKASLPNHEIIYVDPKDPVDVKTNMSDVQVVVGPNLTQELLENAPQLQLVQVPWVGVDRVPLKLLEGRNIQVCNAKWNDWVVAEYAVALLLATAKRLVEVDQSFRKGSWESRWWVSRKIRGSTILLVGFGSIGRELAQMLAPFKAEIFVLKRDPTKVSDAELGMVKKVVGWDDYPSVAPKVDFMICTLPLTAETTGLIDKHKLKLLKPGCIVVNVGRGKTVDEEAFYIALRDGHLGGAGIDVWYEYKRSGDEEPFYPSNFPFHELHNVVMSPHRAATFQDNPDEVWDDTIYNIKALGKREPLRNVVSLQHGY